MAFYIFQLSFLSVFAFITSKTKDKSLFFFAKTISFLILFVPAAVRYGIGTDYFSYMNNFNIMTEKVIKTARTEIGWNYLNFYLRNNGFSYISIFVVSSFLCYFFLMFTKKRDFFIVLIVYYCYLYAFSFNGVRNAVSISMAWYAYICLLDNKKTKAYLILLASSLFHLTAFVYIITFIILDCFSISKKSSIIIIILFTIFFNFFNLRDFILLLPLPKNFAYLYYFSNSQYFGDAIKKTGMGIILRRIYIIIVFLLANRYKSKKEENYCNWLFVFLWISDLFAVDTVIFGRVERLFELAYITFFSHVNFRTKNIYRKLGNIFVLSYLILIVFFHTVIVVGNGEIVPYRTIWSPR